MNDFEKKLWESYTEITPSIEKIIAGLELNNNELFKDHIAFRSIGHKGFGIERLIKPLLQYGYEVKNEYFFKEKKLKGVHLANKFDSNRPKIFISEILLDEFTPFLKHSLLNSVCKNELKDENLYTMGIQWPIEYRIYKRLYKESEYAAWLYAHGYRVNHFTLYINELQKCSIEELCAKLKKLNFSLNESGSLIKGSKESGIKQASTMADSIMMKFEDLKNVVSIPSCYVEFAERFSVNGELFEGFLVKSADKIFESTNMNNAA